MEESVSLMPNSPFAKWKGAINLGGENIDCYVLDTGERVIALRATVKAIADVDSSALADYIGAKALKPFINSELILAELKEFSIPGTQFKSLGLKTEHFELICRGYVQALYKGDTLTDRQRDISIKCAVLTSGLARIGLDALIDEATGYQYVREEDALQVKLRAFIADELRAWEKTFPDELWEEFGRLTNWKQSLHLRPRWWGKLVLELIYDAMDPDVAKYLKENKPSPTKGVNYHQWLSQDVGLKALIPHIHQVIGIAKTCQTMRELRDKVAALYGKKPEQLTMFNDIPDLDQR